MSQSPVEPPIANVQLDILLVEDSLPDAELSLRELRKAGFEVTADVVQTPEEFHERIHARSYDIVLADYNLPRWTGMDALKQLQEEGKDIPFILVTGSLGEETAVECIKQGATDYVLKDRLPRLPVAVRRTLEDKALREERKRAAEALRESERTLATLMSNLRGMAYRCRSEQGWTMEFVSEGCFELTGYRPSDLVQSKKVVYAQLIHPEDREPVWNEVQEAIKQNRPFQLVYRISTAAGDEKWVWEQGRGVFSPEGGLLALEGFITDITERKRAEEELRTAQLQLIQSAKLESVGRLAAGVAHEVKNPLGIIQQGVGYLAKKMVGPDGETTALVLQKLDNAVRRADRVIRGLLDFSAPSALEMRPTDLNGVVEDSLLLVKHELVKAQITVVKSLMENLPPLEMDRRKIEQVFVNLFINATHAMPDGGTLAIKTGTKSLNEIGFDVGSWDSGPFKSKSPVVVVQVEDTGTGIPPEKLDRIFDPFFTTKQPGQGTGLGLSVTRKIIELHGGMIDIRNRSERGVQVTLAFKMEGGLTDEEETDPAH